MKTAVIFTLLVGVAVAQFDNTFIVSGAAAHAALTAPFAPAAPAAPAAAPAGGPAAPGAASATPGAPGAAARSVPNPSQKYGPRVYGMGLNNPWAMPAHPWVMQRALSLLKHVPQALIRLDADGEVTFTNRYGVEVDIQDPFGNDIGDF